MLRSPTHGQTIDFSTDYQANLLVPLCLHTNPTKPGGPSIWRVSVSSLGLVLVSCQKLPLWLSQPTGGEDHRTRVFDADTVDPDHTYPD